MCDIPLDLQRRFEQRWATRFGSLVIPAVPENVGLKAHRSTLRGARQKPSRCEGKSSPVGRRRVLVIAAAVALFAATPACLAHEGPTFRSGLWKFERTLETDGKETNRLQTSGLPIAREMTRCVDPTSAMKAAFAPNAFGVCKTKDVRKTDGGYVFQKICGRLAPIETQIDVKSDSAYTEINQGNMGKISSKEIVVAQRVGDCLRRGG
jgi:hypothetical protein